MSTKQASHLVKYPFPLRPEFVAWVALPHDMTPDEHARIVRWVQSLTPPSA